MRERSDLTPNTKKIAGKKIANKQNGQRGSH